VSHLIAFEGLDQSGKETQAMRLRDWIRGRGLAAEYITFPDYTTPIGQEIRHALHGERHFGPDVMQLLFVANRYERKQSILDMLARGIHVLADRYLASSVAYGEAQGLDPEWLVEIQKHLPQPSRTLMLDIAPETAVRRKAIGRDRYERDLALLARVRESYARQARQPSWVRIDGEQSKEGVAEAIRASVRALGLP
jgi:dTMP kinase